MKIRTQVRLAQGVSLAAAVGTAFLSYLDYTSGDYWWAGVMAFLALLNLYMLRKNCRSESGLKAHNLW